MTNIKLWRRSGWTLIADKREVFPDDPGQGTPLMVEAPNGATATLNCVMGEGVVDEGGKDCIEVPGRVLNWLDEVCGEAVSWVHEEEVE